MQPPRRRPGFALFVWLAPLTALGIALLPTLLLGFPRGHDWPLELTRIAEYRNALAGGQLPPHWAPNVYGGQGSPVFLFYSPLFLLVASAASWIAQPFVASPLTAGASIALWIFAASGFLALVDLLRGLAPQEPAGARVAAILFVLHPYLLTDALLRNANAEFAALCLLPLPLAGVVRLAAGRAEDGAAGGFWRLALGLALVVTAHNLTALVAAAAVAVLGAVLLWDGPRRTQLRFLAACSTGLLLSAWLWLPALGYRHLVRQSELVRGRLDFHNNFGPLVGWGSFSAVGLLPPLALAASLVWLVRRRPTGIAGRVAWTAAAASGVFVFLQLPASIRVWESVPWLPLFQFPWRFQGPLALCIAVLAGLAWARGVRRWPAGRARVAEWLLLLLVVLNAWTHLSNVRPLPPEARGQVARWTEPAAVRDGLRVTVTHEYLPAEGVRADSLPYGPDRAPPLRRLGLTLSLLTALGAATWSVGSGRRRPVVCETRPSG